jgi:hypothetical protein
MLACYSSCKLATRETSESELKMYVYMGKESGTVLNLDGAFWFRDDGEK